MFTVLTENKLILAIIALLVVSLPELLLVIIPAAAVLFLQFFLKEWFAENAMKPVRIKAEISPRSQERGHPDEWR